MQITVIIDNEVVVEKTGKEITIKICKKLLKQALITAIFTSVPKVAFACTPVKWYKKALDESEMYVYMRLWETVFSDRVVNGFEALQDAPKDVIKWIVAKGYDIEELIDWYINYK